MNIYAGRSFNDISQYPVIPWIFSDYESEKNDENISESIPMRDLSLPMGMLGINEKSEMRKEIYSEIYESVKNDIKEVDHEFRYNEYLKKWDDYYDAYLQKKLKSKNKDISFVQPNQIPYFYATHYSNPTYVAHYLTRIFPYSSVAIEIQGDKFDDPDRMFLSVSRSFQSASTLKDDIREIIPEFYTMSEMFRNINNFDLAQNKINTDNKALKIDDVEMPPWASGLPHSFVINMRINLEKEKLKINKWLDLIFGFKQKGPKAEEAHNIYSGNSYIGNVKLQHLTDADMRNALLRLVEIGVTPLQLFDSECKSRIEKNVFLTKNPIFSPFQGDFIYQTEKNILIRSIKSAKYNRICERWYKNPSNPKYSMYIYPKIVKIIPLDYGVLKIISNNNSCYNIKMKLNTENKKIDIEETDVYDIKNQSMEYSPCYQVSQIIIPIIIYNDNKFMIKGGFWDGRIEVNSIEEKDKENYCIYSDVYEPIYVMEMTKDEKFLICGTKSGIIIIFSVNGKFFQLIKKLYWHNDEITSISINDNLNMFVTTAKDDLINLYLLPTFKLVRTIKVELNKTSSGKDNEVPYLNNVFLSSNPLPCITVYISQLRKFRTYTINGINIFENNENSPSELGCPIICRDLNFQEFLIYGIKDGIKIRKFPDMSIVYLIDLQKESPPLTLSLSKDKRFCYAYYSQDEIYVISREGTIMISELKQKGQ